MEIKEQTKKKQEEITFVDRSLKVDAVSQKINLAIPTIYKLMAKGQFPKPLRLSPSSSRWMESDIDDWLQEKRAEAGL